MTKWCLSLLGSALIAAALCAAPAFSYPGVEKLAESSEGNALKVLFIGNSFSPTVAEAFAALAKTESGRPAKVTVAAFPSYSLRQHLANAQTMSALQHDGPWDYVVLQERSHYPVSAQAEMESACAEFDKKIRAVGARTVLLMTWANAQRMGEQPIISAEYTKVGRQIGASVVPAGDMLTRAARSDASLGLYQGDNHHASSAGSYLVACSVFSTLVKDARYLSANPTTEQSFSLQPDLAAKLRAYSAGSGGGSGGGSVGSAPSTSRTSGYTTTRTSGGRTYTPSQGSSRNTVKTYSW